MIYWLLSVVDILEYIRLDPRLVLRGPRLSKKSDYGDAYSCIYLYLLEYAIGSLVVFRCKIKYY